MILTALEPKFQRLDEHLVTLSVLRDAFIKSDPYNFRREVRDGGRQHCYIVTEQRALLPMTFGILLGECLYHFRSSLDHLTLLTVPAALKVDVENTTQFPIVHNDNAFATFRGRHLRGVPDDAVTAIKEMQIYRPGGMAALLWLDILSNVDRHRRILVAGASVNWLSHDLVPEGEPVEWRLSNVPLEVGAEIGCAVFSKPKPDVDMNTNFSYNLQFFEPGARGLNVVETLRQIQQAILDWVIPALTPFIM
jgi:hypothetical protein